jgi:hypothetical protein
MSDGAQTGPHQHTDRIALTVPQVADRLGVAVDLFALWQAPIVVIISAAVDDGLSWGGGKLWERCVACLPAAAGLWLGVTSARAITAPGRLNRLGAVVGIAGAAWLFWFSWRTVIA